MIHVRRDIGELYLGVATIIVLTIGLLAIAGAATSTAVGSPLNLWIASGVVPLLYILLLAWWTSRERAASPIFRTIGIVLFIMALAIYGSALGWVLVIAHRFSVLPIALSQAAIVSQFSKLFREPAGFAAMFVAASFAWALELAIMWLPIDDFLLAGTRVEAFATIAFIVVLAVVTVDSLRTDVRSGIESSQRSVRTWISLVACLLFLELGLRTDRLLADWIPYHRSYFAGPANFVRHGHWLLWDVPSQYGFLSILTVAFFPGKTTWESLYLMTATFLAIQASLLFWILRYGKQGWLNIVASLIICSAIFYGNQAVRFPFGEQLYPQEGIRFIWSITMLCSMFGAYAYRERPRIARCFTCAGWSSWLIAILWSFETGIMSTVAWLAYLLCGALVRVVSGKQKAYELRRCLVRQLLPLIALPSAMAMAIYLYYLHVLGRPPDWLSYIEFSNIYAAGKVEEAQAVKVALFGTGLALVAVLTGIATFASLILRRKASEAFPLAGGAAALAWATSIYYIAEPFNQHVNAIVCVFAIVFGIFAIVARDLQMSGISYGLSQAMIVPIYVMFAAQLLGEPARLLAMVAPFTPHYRISDAGYFPPIQGELATLLRRAKIGPGDRINTPNAGGGAKLSTGVTMPFVSFDDGEVAELQPWLPMTPIGALNELLTLPPARRQQYIDRFLARETPIGGWLITYHQPGLCSQISPILRNVKSFSSANFSATLCIVKILHPVGSSFDE